MKKMILRIFILSIMLGGVTPVSAVKILPGYERETTLLDLFSSYLLVGGISLISCVGGLTTLVVSMKIVGGFQRAWSQVLLFGVASLAIGALMGFIVAGNAMSQVRVLMLTGPAILLSELFLFSTGTPHRDRWSHAFIKVVIAAAVAPPLYFYLSRRLVM